MLIFSLRQVFLVGWFYPGILRGHPSVSPHFSLIFRPCPSDCNVPFDYSDPLHNERRRFIRQVGRGPFANPSQFTDIVVYRGEGDFCADNCLRGVSSRYSHFPWAVLANWKVRVQTPVIPNAQWNVRLRCNVFPYGGLTLWMMISGHFPQGAEPTKVVEELCQLDPRNQRGPKSLVVGGEALSANEVLNAFGRMTVGGMFPEASWNLDKESLYSILLLTRTSPSPLPERDFGMLAGLSRGVPSWESLADDILDSYKQTDYGLFKQDVCFIRRSGILAYLPDPFEKVDTGVRRKRVLWWILRPAELAVLQGVIARDYIEDVRRTRAELMRARFNAKSRVRNFLRSTFVQATPLLFLRDLTSFQEGLPAGEAKLYHRIAAVAGIDQRLVSLREVIHEFVDECESWEAPVLSVLRPLISVGRKFAGV